MNDDSVDDLQEKYTLTEINENTYKAIRILLKINKNDMLVSMNKNEAKLFYDKENPFNEIEKDEDNKSIKDKQDITYKFHFNDVTTTQRNINYINRGELDANGCGKIIIGRRKIWYPSGCPK